MNTLTSKTTPTAGLFITFEGIDGSGKSTQMSRCQQALETAGYATVMTRNPGGTELGQGIRKILLHHPGYVSPRCELLLYIADRAQHMDEVISPALAKGQIILCDRHIDSTLAYQGYGRNLDHATIEQLNTMATQGQKPDLTLFLDGPPAVLLDRVNRRGEVDRLEQEALDFFERTAQGYRTIATQEPHRFKVLDALKPVDALHKEIMNLIHERLATSG